jgi:hypothetical protein
VDLVCSNAILYFGSDHAMHISARNLLSSRKTASETTKADIQPLPNTAESTNIPPRSAEKEKQRPDPNPKQESIAAGPVCLPIGTTVEMLFGDGVWYEGVIQRFSARSGLYTIVFPDGDVQTAKLPDKDVRVLGSTVLPGQGSQLLISRPTNGHRRSSAGPLCGVTSAKDHAASLPPSLFLPPRSPTVPLPLKLSPDLTHALALLIFDSCTDSFAYFHSLFPFPLSLPCLIPALQLSHSHFLFNELHCEL